MTALISIALAASVLLSAPAAAQETPQTPSAPGPTPAPQRTPGLAPQPAAPASQPVNKLIDPERIFQAFGRGAQGRAAVVVNLVEPPGLLRDANWDDRAFLDRLKGEIAQRLDAVIAGLPAGQFAIRRRMPLQLSFSAELDVESLTVLQDDPRVQSVEPVFNFDLHLRQGLAIIHALASREKYNGQGVAIAIVDSGIDYRRPPLGAGSFPNQKVIGGYDFAADAPDPLDDQIGHGTACAGIAAGSTAEAGDYVGGVACNAKLYALKVTRPGVQGVPLDWLMAAWNWAVEHKNDYPDLPILVLGAGLGASKAATGCDAAFPGLSRASKLVEAAGISLFVSSGNNGFCDALCAPAGLESVISVGAVYDATLATQAVFPIDPSSCVPRVPEPASPTGYVIVDMPVAKQVASYSNTAPMLTLLAPGHSAITVDIAGAGGLAPGDYSVPPLGFGGTSAACSYAAGAAACLQQAAKETLNRYLSPREVRDILAAAGEPIKDVKVSIVKPLINLEQAIGALKKMQEGGKTPPPSPTPERTEPPAKRPPAPPAPPDRKGPGPGARMPKLPR